MTIGSLVDAFAPPKGHVGSFGWICGFSADADFLDLACERFTGLSHAHRGREGRVWLGVMLDRTEPQIAPSAAPGVLQLLPYGDLPFRLLHAKVALLCFRPEGMHAGWHLRLVVSTGNWTRQTLDESLDLAWRVDAGSREDDAAAAVDLRASASLLSFLRERFADEALTKAHGPVADENRRAMAHLESALAALPPKSRDDPPARFFDNRSSSLLDQLPALVRANAGGCRRNAIYLGSGFFEGGGRAGQRPKVVQAVIDRLQQGSLLTGSAWVTLIVNPSACQQVAVAGSALSGWSVCAAHDPTLVGGAARSLHAKFVFSANYRDNSDRCSSAWLYIGSGNLTPSGFLNRAGPTGNLEAGVVIAADDLAWSELSAWLPIDCEATDLAEDLEALHAGGDAPPRPPDALAPPFAFLCWSIDETGSCWLRPPDGALDAVAEIDGPLGAPCLRAEDGRYAWVGEVAPVEVVVRWEADERAHQARVPVLDGFGRLAGRPLPALDLAGIIDELTAFPQRPEDDDTEPDADVPIAGTGGSTGGGGSAVDRTPIRSMMQLIETIATRNDNIDALAWPSWCSRLEQALLRGTESDTVRAINDIGINPLGVLRRPEFRPDFAETTESSEGALYEGVLQRVEEAWGWDDLEPFVSAEST